MCTCADKDQYLGNKAAEFERQLDEIVVDAYKMRTLLQCRECDEYWEETHPDMRLQAGGPLVLMQVSKEYVAREWGIDE